MLGKLVRFSNRSLFATVFLKLVQLIITGNFFFRYNSDVIKVYRLFYSRSCGT